MARDLSEIPGLAFYQQILMRLGYLLEMKKNRTMRKLHKNDKLKFYLGDVRDYDACFDVVQGVDYVFHAAMEASTIM